MPGMRTHFPSGAIPKYVKCGNSSKRIKIRDALIHLQTSAVKDYIVLQKMESSDWHYLERSIMPMSSCLP